MYSKKPGKKFLLLMLFVFMAGAAAGVFLFGHGGNAYVEKAGIFSDYELKQYAYLDIDRKELTCMVARERGKWFLLMWAVGFTWTGIFWVYGFSALWGFFTGILLSAAFLRKGIKGLGLLFLCGMPQMLIYVPLWVWLLHEVYKRSMLCRSMRKAGTVSKGWKQYIFCLAKGFAILLLGILTESYLNSWIVQQILRFI